MRSCVRGRSFPRQPPLLSYISSLQVVLLVQAPTASSASPSSFAAPSPTASRVAFQRPPPTPLLSSSLLVLFRLPPASSSFAVHAPDGLASPFYSCYSSRRSSTSSTSSSPPSSSLFQPPLAPLAVSCATGRPPPPPPPPPPRLRRPLTPDFRAKLRRSVLRDISVSRPSGHIRPRKAAAGSFFWRHFFTLCVASADAADGRRGGRAQLAPGECSPDTRTHATHAPTPAGDAAPPGGTCWVVTSGVGDAAQPTERLFSERRDLVDAREKDGASFVGSDGDGGDDGGTLALSGFCPTSCDADRSRRGFLWSRLLRA